MFNKTLFFLLLTVCLGGCSAEADTPKPPADLSQIPSGLEVATFAGGCFWCMESPFDKLPGVASTVSGYIDGDVKDPVYRDVARGLTGHTEAVQIVFDPKKISYETLLKTFWRNIDPVAKDRQFCDAGTQYRSGIYYYGPAQKQAALSSKEWAKKEMKATGAVATEIKEATRFYRAEEYHQDYYKKNPKRYSRYRQGCGRDARLLQIWGPHKK